MPDSPHQLAIYEALASPGPNIFVDAKAGSGKTTTIVNALNRVSAYSAGAITPSIVRLLAFNKAIAEELQKRVPAHITCSTYHSLGFRALNSMLQKPKLETSKLRKIVWNSISDRDYPDTQAVIRLVGLAKNSAMSCDGGLEDTDSSWRSLAEHYDLDLEEPDQSIRYARRALELSFTARTEIDFDDMIYMPVRLGCRFTPADLICVDEAQDTNALQIHILRRLRGTATRFLFVGDPHQCHPTGTMIDTPNGKRAIETLTTLDYVIGYHRDKLNFRERKVLAVAKRQFCGELLAIMTETTHHKVTHNHRCFVRVKPNASGYVLYVMQKGLQVRLGITQIHQTGKNGFGPGLRGRQEHADNVWVLSVHPTQQDALIHEKAVGARFGISDMCFMNSGEVATSQAVLDAAWSIVGDGTERLKSLLKNYGRDIDYPMWSKNDNTHIGFKSFITAACNIFPEFMEVGVRNEQELVWSSFTLHKFPYYGDVWSLSVEADPTTGRRLYVAEDIVTHNSIYGFRGAGVNAVETIIAEFKCTTMPLSVCYRCGTDIVRHAQSEVPAILPFEGNATGNVLNLGHYVAGDFRPGDAVLCRNVAPLVSHAFALLGRDVPCVIAGRDIGQQLVALVKRMGAQSLEEFRTKLTVWYNRELEVCHKEQRSPESVTDRYQVLNFFAEGLDEHSRSVASLIAKIELMFVDASGIGTGKVTLSSIHKAKGMEWDRVYFLDHSLIPSPYAKKPWQAAQETNLRYVAKTRAKYSLIYISSDCWKDEKEAK